MPFKGVLGQKPRTLLLKMANKKVEGMDYLICEKGVYYFRKVVPEKLQAAYGQKSVKRSLRTGDLKEAKLLCMRVSVEVHAALDALTAKTEIATHKALILDAALIVKLSALYKRWLFLQDDIMRSEMKEFWGSATAAKNFVITTLAEKKHAMADMNYSVMSVPLTDLLSDNNIELITPTDELLNTLKQSMLRASIAYYTEAAARDAGEHTPTSEIAPPVVLDATLSDGDNLLSIYDLWLKQKPRATKTASSYLHTATSFNEWVKGIPAIAIKGEQVRDWVAELSKKSAYKTILNKYKQLIAIGNVGVRYDALTSNPFTKAVVSEDMGVAKIPRRPYTVEEITKIMTHIEASSKVSLYDKWLLALAYTTGARQRELAQLQINDIEEVEGMWCIKITGDGKGQHLKNASSRRRIPLHPDLIAAGFIRWVDGLKKARPATSRIFPFTPDKHGNPAAAYSKRYASMAKKVLGETSDTCFHSLRHHYVDLLRLVPGYSVIEHGKRVADKLTGHSDGSVVEKYGAEFYPVQPLLNLVKQVKLVAMPTLTK